MSARTSASRGPSDPAGRSELDRLDASLRTLIGHVEFLRLRPRLPGPTGPGPHDWPVPPTPVGSGRGRWMFAGAAVVVGGLIVWGAADGAMSVFGSPPRPVLVGHKVGYPWNIDPAPVQPAPSP